MKSVKSDLFNRGTIEAKLVSAEAMGPKERVDRHGSVADVSAIAIDSRSDAPATSPETSPATSPATQAELYEFLAADYLETRADPEFRERLRKDLWALVWNRYGPGSSSGSR